MDRDYNQSHNTRIYVENFHSREKPQSLRMNKSIVFLILEIVYLQQNLLLYYTKK